MTNRDAAQWKIYFFTIPYFEKEKFNAASITLRKLIELMIKYRFKSVLNYDIVCHIA